MKKVYLTLNYKAKVQVLDGANPDELQDNLKIDSTHWEVDCINYELEEMNVFVDPENSDFLKIDTRFKAIVLINEDADLEDLVENGALEIDVDDDFIVWDWEIYGWGVEDVK